MLELGRRLQSEACFSSRLHFKKNIKASPVSSLLSFTGVLSGDSCQLSYSISTLEPPKQLSSPPIESGCSLSLNRSFYRRPCFGVSSSMEPLHPGPFLADYLGGWQAISETRIPHQRDETSSIWYYYTIWLPYLHLIEVISRLFKIWDEFRVKEKRLLPIKWLLQLKRKRAAMKEKWWTNFALKHSHCMGSDFAPFFCYNR